MSECTSFDKEYYDFKKCKKLYIHIHCECVYDFIKKIEDNLSNGWARSVALEKQYEVESLLPKFCFCQALANGEEYLLWLRSNLDGKFLTVVEICKFYSDQKLSFKEYNKVQECFSHSALGVEEKSFEYFIV